MWQPIDLPTTSLPRSSAVNDIDCGECGAAAGETCHSPACGTWDYDDTNEVLAAMRDWIADCGFRHEDGQPADDLTDDEVRRAVANLYEGGAEQFLADMAEA